MKLYIQKCRNDDQLKFQQQNSKIFGPIFLKKIKISNAHNFGNTGPILKIPMLLSSDRSFPLWNFMTFGEGQMKNSNFAGSLHMDWPQRNVEKNVVNRALLVYWTTPLYMLYIC